jgi:hypothetical protein
MANLPTFPRASSGSASPDSRVRLVVMGFLHGEDSDIALKLTDDNETLEVADCYMNGEPSIWIQNWTGEKVFLRQCEHGEAVGFDSDMYGPTEDDQLYCEEGDERALWWMREVDEAEFDKVARIEAAARKEAEAEINALLAIK